MRIGDWCQTALGKQFWPMDPRAEEVELLDVAHALANQCRFGGHTKMFYSVAEHCVRVSYVVPLEQALAGLLHDAAEAYLVDLPRPIKRSPGFTELYLAAGERVERTIAERFGLPFEALHTPAIKHADDVLLRTEQRDLMALPPAAWQESAVRSLVEVITPWSPREAHYRFLAQYAELEGLSWTTEDLWKKVGRTRTL